MGKPIKPKKSGLVAEDDDEELSESELERQMREMSEYDDEEEEEEDMMEEDQEHSDLEDIKFADQLTGQQEGEDEQKEGNHEDENLLNDQFASTTKSTSLSTSVILQIKTTNLRSTTMMMKRPSTSRAGGLILQAVEAHHCLFRRGRLG